MFANETRMNLRRAGLMVILLLASAGIAQAQSAGEAPGEASVGFDVEIDPLAYALEGHSLHVGVWLGRVRLDLGSFGLVVPTFAHGNDNFEVSFSGYGTKADLYFNDDRDGVYLGVQLGVSRVTTRRVALDLAEVHMQSEASGRIGYRWLSKSGFYVTPWVGVGYTFGAKDVALGGEVLEGNPLLIFPTVHLGYQRD